jgi:hypothetical protein
MYIWWCRLVLKVLPGEAAEQDLLDTMESLVRQLAEETQPPVILRLLNTTRHGEKRNNRSSVADPGCLSRILIFVHPGSQISDPGSKNSNKREG